MRNLIRVFFLVSLSTSAWASGPSFIIQRNSGLPVTIFNLTFRVGSADDPQGSAGLAALTADLLREGGVKELKTPSGKTLPARTRAEIEDFLYPLASNIHMSVEREQVSITATTSMTDADAVFDLITQILLAPAFDAQEFERVKSEFLDAVQKRAPREDQESLGKAALEQRMYGREHPYGHIVDGSVDGLKSITREKVIQFHRDLFTKNRLTVGAAGMITPGLEKKLRTVFANLPEGKTSQANVPDVARKSGVRLLLVKGPFTATGVHLGQPISINRGSAEFPEMYLAALTFGKHRSFVGRLMKVVREIRGLNYGTYSYIEEFPHGGELLAEPTQVSRTRQAFTLWGRPTTLENGCFLLRQVYREVSNVTSIGLTEKEFKSGKNFLVGSIPLMAMSFARRLGYAIDAQFYGIDGDYIQMLQSKVKNADLKRVNALLKKYIDPKTLDIVVVTPDPQKFKSEILGSSCSIHYAPGVNKPQEILDEDQVISRFKIPLKESDIEIVESESLF